MGKKVFFKLLYLCYLAILFSALFYFSYFYYDRLLFSLKPSRELNKEARIAKVFSVDKATSLSKSVKERPFERKTLPSPLASPLEEPAFFEDSPLPLTHSSPQKIYIIAYSSPSPSSQSTLQKSLDSPILSEEKSRVTPLAIEHQAFLRIKSPFRVLEYALPVVTQKTTVLDLLLEAKKKYGLSVVYSGTGPSAFIEAIDGVQNSDHYWLYYINGEFAELGAGSQKVQPGDLIEWRFE